MSLHTLSHTHTLLFTFTHTLLITFTHTPHYLHTHSSLPLHIALCTGGVFSLFDGRMDQAVRENAATSQIHNLSDLLPDWMLSTSCYDTNTWNFLLFYLKFIIILKTSTNNVYNNKIVTLSTHSQAPLQLFTMTGEEPAWDIGTRG